MSALSVENGGYRTSRLLLQACMAPCRSCCGRCVCVTSSATIILCDRWGMRFIVDIRQCQWITLFGAPWIFLTRPQRTPLKYIAASISWTTNSGTWEILENLPETMYICINNVYSCAPSFPRKYVRSIYKYLVLLPLQCTGRVSRWLVRTATDLFSISTTKEHGCTLLAN
jgi:hypothetical protein